MDHNAIPYTANIFNPHEHALTPELINSVNSVFAALKALTLAYSWGREDIVQPMVYIDEDGDMYLGLKGPNYHIENEEEEETGGPSDDAFYAFCLIEEDSAENWEYFIAMLDQMQFGKDIGNTPTLKSQFIRAMEEGDLDELAMDTSISLKDVVLAPIRIPVAVADKMLSYLRRI